MREKTRKVMRACMALILAFVIVQMAVPVTAQAQAELNETKASLVVGETLALKVSDTDGSVTWSSSKKSVATVSKAGVVTAKKKGSATITAKVSGKKLTCKVKIDKIPKNYAVVNGKKVKVGKKVTISWSVQSDQGICSVTEMLQYNKKALTIANMDDSKGRFKVWWDNDTQIDDYKDDETGKTYDLYKLRNLDKKALKKDPMNIIVADVDCSTAKVIDTIKFKVNKSGNYKVKNNFRFSGKSSDGILKSSAYTVTETVKK